MVRGYADGHLYNRSVSVQSDKIPFSRWYSKVDDRKFFEFGEKVTFIKPKTITSKNAQLVVHSGIFMGYARNRKAYRVLPDGESQVVYDVIGIKSLIDKSSHMVCSVFDDMVNSKSKIPNHYKEIESMISEEKVKWYDLVRRELQSMQD